jgi:hypothetical protein
MTLTTLLYIIRLALSEMDMENSSTHPTEYSLGGDDADGESET